MSVKFSQFTPATDASTLTDVVGFISSSQTNVKIPPANLDTTYSVATTQNASDVNFTITGAKTGQASTTETIAFKAGTGMTLTAGTDEITFASSGAVTSVDKAAGATSTGDPITVAGTAGAGPFTGAITVASNAYGGSTNVGHVPTGGSPTTFLNGNGGWSTPSGGFANWVLQSDSGGNETVNSAETVIFTDDGSGSISTATSNPRTISLGLNSAYTLWTLSGGDGAGTNQAITGGNTVNIIENTTTNINSVIVGGGIQTKAAATDDLLIDQTSTLTVTVVDPGSGNVFYIDGAQITPIVLPRGFTYEFNQDAATNNGHPLVIGTASGSSPYTTGIQYYGSTSANTLTAVSQGTYAANPTTTFDTWATRRVRLRITQNTPTLYFYCSIHGAGMGGTIAYGATGGLATVTVDQTTISNATTGTVTLSVTPTSEAYVDMYVSGVYQNKSVYSVTGTTVTLDSSAYFPNGSIVETVTTT